MLKLGTWREALTGGGDVSRGCQKDKREKYEQY